MVSRVGRDLAPYLKALAPSWYLSCSDPHAPAASMAKSAFQKAFHDESAKLREAIMFCKEEILALLLQNLIHHTPNSLSDPK